MSDSVRQLVSRATVRYSEATLTRSWARRFILATLLPRMQSIGNTTTTSSSSSSSSSAVGDTVTAQCVLHAQRVLSEAWSLPVQSLDAASERAIFRALAQYACGEAVIEGNALCDVNAALQLLTNTPHAVEQPPAMRALLERVGYVQPGDNLHRVSYHGGALTFVPAADAVAQWHVRTAVQAPGGDVYDALRDVCAGPAYAIDSATTSEVDDAIAVDVDAVTGAEVFTVHVSDATVYCPVGSALDELTGRALSTTTYLPECVFFMLPRRVVDTATLREDQPCRTLVIRFSVHATSGELYNYSVGVAWLRQLRRLTYDHVQPLLQTTTTTATTTDSSSSSSSSTSAHDHDKRHAAATATLPSWVTDADVQRLRRIYAAAQLRFASRMRRAADEGIAAIDANLPQPHITVTGTRVRALCDATVATCDARLAVAELMIAANEVCSRVAQQQGVSMPFRGTRLASDDHDVAALFVEPQGVRVVASLDTHTTFFAQAMHNSVRRLGAVTRAVYGAAPMFHRGLLTRHYAHSTSPLRRYADMVVHHQLKAMLWRRRWPHAANPSHGGSRGAATEAGQLLPEYAVAQLCTTINDNQERKSVLQEASTRYWTLSFVRDTLLPRAAAATALQQQRRDDAAAAAAERDDGDDVSASTTVRCVDGQLRFVCLLGETRRVDGSTEYDRFAADTDACMRAIALSHNTTTAAATATTARAAAPLFCGRWQQRAAEHVYVSEVYIPRLQLAHVLFHSDPQARVGALVECAVVRVEPTAGVLELRLCGVYRNVDERAHSALWLGGAVASLDA